MSDNRRNATLKALIDAAITELMIKTSGEQIYLDDNTTLSSKMAEMVTAINLRDKKTDVDAKIKTVTDSLNSTSESLGNAISTLRSEKADKTNVTEQITALKQEIMGDLPVEAYDTFTELAAYIEEHQEAADALTAAIGNKADKTVVDDILTVINGLGALANKDKVAKDDLDASLQTELDAKATTEAMNTALATKSDTNHTHDDRYYTKAETDTAIANAPKGDTGVWISQADYDALSDEDKALDLNYYIYDAKSNSGSDSSGISISQAEYNALSVEEKASEATYYIYDANSNPNAASIPFTSENYTATNVGAALEEVNGKLGNEYFSLQLGTSEITPVGTIASYDKASKMVFIAFAVLGSRKADEVIYVVPEKYRPSNNVQGVCILKTSGGDVTIGSCSIRTNGYCVQTVTNAGTNCIMCIFNYGI